MHGLDRLLRPKSIAVIGGGGWCANVIAQCRAIGYAGDIWPVHPTRATVAGLPVFSNVAALPAAPDAAFIGVNRAATVEVVSGLSARGAGGAVCFASGFRESQAETGDGGALQEALLAAAGDMTILGPNCYGMLNYLDGAALWPDQHGGRREEAGVAIVTQSSNIAINLTMQTRGLPLAYVVTAGNQAQTGLPDIARALLIDPRVTAVGLHIEGIRDLPAFCDMAEEAQRLGKPVVALKVGRSDQAQAATVSHTASLAGSDAGARALLTRLGIGWVSSLGALIETLKLLHVTGPLASDRIASISCSGGEASLMADMGQSAGLIFPPLGTDQRSRLGRVLGAKVALSNPLDYHTYIWGDEEAMADCFAAMLSPEIALGVLVLDFPREDRCDRSAWGPAMSAAERAQAETGRQLAILASLPENMPEAVARDLLARGIAPLCGMGDGLEAIRVAADMGRKRVTSDPPLIPVPADTARILTEVEAKSILESNGLRVPRSERAGDAMAAAAAAARIGFPVVLKGEGVAHKTEAGAVALGLVSSDAVAAAARAMACDGFLVEEMIAGGVAELLIGVVSDPAHGYVLTLAAGGTLAELLDDQVSLLVPASEDEIRQALSRLRIAPLFGGYRGAAPADLGRIVGAVLAVQSCVLALRPLEIEINPLICGADFAVAADALIRIGDRHD